MQRSLAKHQITQVTQPPHSPDLVPCDLWLSPKLKSPLKGKIFQTVNEIQENTTGQVMVIWRTVWSLKVPTLKGLRCHCPMYNISCIFFNKCLYFSYYMAGYLMDRPVIYILGIWYIHMVYMYMVYTYIYGIKWCLRYNDMVSFLENIYIQERTYGRIYSKTLTTSL